MTPALSPAQAQIAAANRAWRARIRLEHELRQVGAIGQWVPAVRTVLLGTASHWAMTLVQMQGGAR